jgi:hypothetical protein
VWRERLLPEPLIDATRLPIPDPAFGGSVAEPDWAMTAAKRCAPFSTTFQENRYSIGAIGR